MSKGPSAHSLPQAHSHSPALLPTALWRQSFIDWYRKGPDSMSKNFLHVCLSPSWGGLEMAVGRWNDILKEKGHRNFNLCSPNSPLEQELLKKGAWVKSLSSRPYLSPSFSFQFRNLVKKEKCFVPSLL